MAFQPLRLLPSRMVVQGSAAWAVTASSKRDNAGNTGFLIYRLLAIDDITRGEGVRARWSCELVLLWRLGVAQGGFQALVGGFEAFINLFGIGDLAVIHLFECGSCRLNLQHAIREAFAF